MFFEENKYNFSKFKNYRKKSNDPNQTEKELMIMLPVYCAIGICEMWNKNV